MNHPPKNEEPGQRLAASSSKSTNDKLRAFAEAREKANAETRELGPTLGRHLLVIVAGLFVLAIWGVQLALRGCSVQH